MSKLNLLNILSLLSLEVYSISKLFPNDENFGLTSQLRRAVISVRLNVREGNSFKDKRKITHFQRALGSLEEVDECVLIAFDLRYINKNQLEIFRLRYWECLNKLKKLISSITQQSQ